MQKILCVIPARGGSKEIPMKNIIKLNSKPMLYYSIKCSLNSKFISRTIVSTDNEKIAKIGSFYGAEIIKRPKKLSNGKLPMEPVIEHVLQTLKRKENYIPEIIIVLPNTSPLREVRHVDEAIKKFQKGRYDSLTSGYVGTKFLWNKKGDFIYPINNNPKKRPNRQEVKNQYIENGAIHITKYEKFIKNKSKLSGKIGIYEMPEVISFEIDSMYDLQIAEFLLKNKILN